jgi:hypothetical protein
VTHEDRVKIHELLELLIAHRAQLGYPEGDVRGARDAATFSLDREQALRWLKDGHELTFDCSGCATCVFKWTPGLRDPNGLNYRHQGYTGTMLAHLPHYHYPADARIGALVVFGPGTGDHVAQVLEPGRDPWLFNHGRSKESGPVRLSVEREAHRAPVTFLSVASL